jgi:hypothetical protein
MPSREKHLGFDEFLRRKGVICDDTDGNSVHARMDRGARKYGADHREQDYFHSDAGIRDTIDNLLNSIGTIQQTTATDYIRIAYGHVSLDYMVSKLKEHLKCHYRDFDWEAVYQRTWNYFRRKGFHKTYYRRR